MSNVGDQDSRMLNKSCQKCHVRDIPTSPTPKNLCEKILRIMYTKEPKP